MKRLGAMAALVATTFTAAGAAPAPSRGIEEDYYTWRAVKVDSSGGSAFFVANEGRAGNAVQFRMLAVYRDLQRPSDVGRRGVELDKELFEFLGDCGSRMLLTTGYRYQKGTEFTPPPIIAAPTAEVPLEGSTRSLALAAACGPAGAPGEWIKAPYAWAKERLRQARP